MTIAAQLYSVREFTKTPEDIEKTFKKVKQIGYNAVQVSGMGPIDPLRLKEIADELGIKICITHTPYDRIKNDTDAVIKEHKLWGCEAVGLGGMPPEFRSSREGFVKFAADFAELGRKFAAEGLRLDYHNHKFEFEKFDGVTGMDILINETDPKSNGFILDTYWVQAGGANPVEWIKKVAGRMSVIHLKDMAIVKDQQVFAEIGEGNIDWQSVIDACRQTGVKWYAVEQDVCRRNPFESLEMSFKFLKKMTI